MIKKIISIPAILLLVICMTISVFTYANEIPHDISIIFDENTSFTQQEKTIIEQSFRNEQSQPVIPCGLYCLIFGHDYQTEIVTVIKHKVNPSPPRCIEERYSTKICTRCSDTVSTLISIRPINCCP